MKTQVYMLTETSKFMMSFIIVTSENHAIVVDGGRAEDMPLLKEYLNGRHISAWILTHPHNDHISGLVSEMEKNGGADFDIGQIVYNFPDSQYLYSQADKAPDRDYFLSEIEEILPAFEKQVCKFQDKVRIIRQGECMDIDEVHIEFLYTWHDGCYSNLMNDASLVFKVTGPNKTMLFLGDLGPEAGDILMAESRNLLKADYVQMAHHGHMNVSMEVYAQIAPEACFWTAPLWLYQEEEVPGYLANVERARQMQRLRMFGTKLTRKWMDLLGVRKHYVSGEGTVCVDL